MASRIACLRRSLFRFDGALRERRVRDKAGSDIGGPAGTALRLAPGTKGTRNGNGFVGTERILACGKKFTLGGAHFFCKTLEPAISSRGTLDQMDQKKDLVKFTAYTCRRAFRYNAG